MVGRRCSGANLGEPPDRPLSGGPHARHWIVATIVAVYAFAAAANAWWSRGRGFGWKALGAVVVLAVAGY